MRPVSAVRTQAGFTLTEALVAMAVLGIVVGIGAPRMASWVSASKAGSATQFYAEGFALARNQALTHNSESRLVLTANANNSQYDWQVDICFPTPATPCNSVSGTWSTTSAAAGSDPEGANGFKSVLRRADALPGLATMSRALTPSNATAVYFTPLGWVDTTVAPSLQRIDLTPATSGAFRPAAVVVTLAGVVSKCDPSILPTAHDSRGCPQ
ncbi:MAG: pilus assembly FimT family protein [Telluria sp.]